MTKMFMWIGQSLGEMLIQADMEDMALGEFDHHAASTSFLDRLWCYFRKMSNPLPEQPSFTKFGIRARLLWCDPGHQRWRGPSSQFILYNFSTPSTFCSQPGFPLPRLRTGFDTCTFHLGAFSGPVCHSCFNIQQHQWWQQHLLRPCTTPSSALPVPCPSSEPSLPDPASAATTASSLSRHHQQSAWSIKLHIGWRHCDHLVLP